MTCVELGTDVAMQPNRKKAWRPEPRIIPGIRTPLLWDTFKGAAGGSVNTAPTSTQSSEPLEVAGNVVELAELGIKYSAQVSVVHALVNPLNPVPADMVYPPWVAEAPIKRVSVP